MLGSIVRTKLSSTRNLQLSASSRPGQSRNRFELASNATINCLRRFSHAFAASTSSGRPTRPSRILRDPRSSTGPCAPRPRRGSTSRAAFANSSSGSGRTSIFSGSTTDQTSFLNIDGDEAPFEQQIVNVTVANVDRWRSLREEARPERQIALHVRVAIELDPAGCLAGAHVARQRRDAVALREHVKRFNPDAPDACLLHDFVPEPFAFEPGLLIFAAPFYNVAAHILLVRRIVDDCPVVSSQRRE